MRGEPQTHLAQEQEERRDNWHLNWHQAPLCEEAKTLDPLQTST